MSTKSYFGGQYDSPSDSLTHYGVKGMKWGVRKAQANANVANYRQGISSRYASRPQTISESEYKKLDTKDSVLAKKNQEAYRIANAANSALNGKTYISVDKRDNDVYAALLDASGNSKAKKSQLILGVNEDLISPSKKQRVDTFIEVLNSDIPFQGKTIKGRDLVSYTLADKAASTKDLGLKYYNQFAQSQVMNTPLSTKYFDTIRKKGYNALLDDADANLVTKLPVIVLDSKKSLTVKSQSVMSKLEILEAQEQLQDFLKKGA